MSRPRVKRFKPFEYVAMTVAREECPAPVRPNWAGWCLVALLVLLFVAIVTPTGNGR